MSTKQSKKQPPSRAAKRARFAEQKKSGTSPLLLFAGVVVVLALIGGAIFALTRPADAASPKPDDQKAGDQELVAKAATSGHDPYPLAVAENGVVEFPLSTFDDYRAHHYTYMHEGHPIEFFVLKSKDGIVRAAFNACDVCFDAAKGYSQDGDYMVCNNCGRRFPANQINVVRGGCNPSPLSRTVEGDTLLIHVKDIIAGLYYF